MKKSVLRLIPAFIFAALSFEAAAQNVQFHYDLGRKAPTTTLEMFRADGAGSTFFFVDLDYNPRVSGAYWEISREFCFWQESKVNWLSLHLEYNGGLNTDAGSFNNAWLAGLTYSGQLPADRRMEPRFLQSLDLLQRFRRLLARGKTLAGY